MSLIFSNERAQRQSFDHTSGMQATYLLSAPCFGATALAQTGVISPLAQGCNASLPKVLCIEKYAAVMPYHFFTPTANGTSTPTFRSTSVPNDTSFGLVNQSDFLVFDRERGLDLLGPSPGYEFVFDVSMVVHETPVYVVAQNKLYLSQVLSPKPTASIGVQQLPQLAPPPGFLPQLVINLNQSPPTLSGIPLKPTRLRTQRRHIP